MTRGCTCVVTLLHYNVHVLLYVLLRCPTMSSNVLMLYCVTMLCTYVCRSCNMLQHVVSCRKTYEQCCNMVPMSQSDVHVLSSVVTHVHMLSYDLVVCTCTATWCHMMCSCHYMLERCACMSPHDLTCWCAMYI